MNDDAIHGTIEELIAEEHKLWEQEASGHADDSTRARLKELKVSLDQLWDLLRRRRAAREAGADPAREQLRDADTVEHYRQ